MKNHSIWRASISSLILSFLLPLQIASAENQYNCNTYYTVQAGDTLTKIALNFYQAPNAYQPIYDANPAILTGGPAFIVENQELFIPCTTTKKTQPEPKKPQHFRLLTSGQFPPFTDKSLPEGGLLTDMFITLTSISDTHNTYSVHWINDRSAHTDTLLKEGMFDIGFPWFKQSCDEKSCQYLYSDSVINIPILLYTLSNSPFTYKNDDDIKGKVFCRPVNYSTHDLDRPDRQWISQQKITLRQAENAEACFDLLINKQVDTVAINEYTAREILNKSKWENKVEALQKPVSQLSLAALVHKDHPKAKAIVKTINKGIRSLKDSDEYDKILDKHLSRHWLAIQ